MEETIYKKGRHTHTALTQKKSLHISTTENTFYLQSTGELRS